MGTEERLQDYFGERIKAERVSRKWSQSKVAQLLLDKGIDGIYATTIAKLEKNERAVRIAEACALADLFEVSLDSLLGRSTGLDNDLRLILRDLKDVASKASSDVGGLYVAILERTAELADLEFEGCEALHAAAVRAAEALLASRTALAKVAVFELPAKAAIGLREGVIRRELDRIELQRQDDQLEPWERHEKEAAEEKAAHAEWLEQEAE
jgi:transcriptional regulator with XRE-family HTH domain